MSLFAVNRDAINTQMFFYSGRKTECVDSTLVLFYNPIPNNRAYEWLSSKTVDCVNRRSLIINDKKNREPPLLMSAILV